MIQHHYSVYGVSLQSDVPFDLPPASGPLDDRPQVCFLAGADDDFAVVGERDSDEDFTCRALEGGAVYLRWTGLFEFLVNRSGTCVRYQPLRRGDAAVLKNFLFGQTLAFALIRQNVEPLHAAVVDLGGYAVAFLGDCTYGKSTLAGALIRAGCRLVSDDVLVVHASSDCMLARAGAGRIKLLPDSAAAILPGARTGVRIIANADKCVFRLDPHMVQSSDVPLRAFAVLPAPDQREGYRQIAIRRISGPQVFRELVRNTFVRYLHDGSRLQQNFAWNTRLAAAIPGYELCYPPGIDRLPAIARATLDHFRRIATKEQ